MDKDFATPSNSKPQPHTLILLFLYGAWGCGAASVYGGSGQFCKPNDLETPLKCNKAQLVASSASHFDLAVFEYITVPLFS